MSELRIDAAFLTALSTTVAAAGSELSFVGWHYRMPGASLQSDSVEAALSASTRQQLTRAGLLETLLAEAGAFPAAAAQEFLATDARIARAVF